MHRVGNDSIDVSVRKWVKKFRREKEPNKWRLYCRFTPRMGTQERFCLNRNVPFALLTKVLSQERKKPECLLLIFSCLKTRLCRRHPQVNHVAEQLRHCGPDGKTRNVAPPSARQHLLMIQFSAATDAMCSD